MVVLTLSRGRKNVEAVETVEEMDDVVEEVEDNNNKASTIKQMQEIVLKVQVGFV